MSDLSEFLAARLYEDEVMARWIIKHGCWDGVRVESANAQEAQHIARHGPARVLADVEAKRRIIELHTGDHECSTYDHNGEIDHCTWVIGDCSTLQLLALPDADHSDYDPSWAIE